MIIPENPRSEATMFDPSPSTYHALPDFFASLSAETNSFSFVTVTKRRAGPPIPIVVKSLSGKSFLISTCYLLLDQFVSDFVYVACPHNDNCVILFRDF